MIEVGARSYYDGEAEETTIRIEGRSIRLVRPSEPDRLLDRPEVLAWSASDDYMPYWAYLWPASHLMAAWLARLERPEGDPEILELGSGLGLAGLAALDRGWRVRFTDIDPAAFGFIERSARANGFDPVRYSTAVLDWRTPPPDRYRLIVGADLTYEVRLLPVLASALAALLDQGGLAAVADPGRGSAEGFGRALEAVGLAATPEPIAIEPAEGEPIRGTIYRIAHPG